MWSHRYVGVIKEVNGNKARIVQHTNAKTVVIDLQARLVGMQLATCNNGMCNLQLATMACATCNMQLTTCNACSIQHANCHVCRRGRHQLLALVW